ncbi:iron ABC transporter permease [Rhodoplanes sp. TEM]|uniref:Iron ABC transporter permease n=1 Tax=Rhodoplanes tepidamans TaxID=200616 RepID=A0ABT5JC83_RHOTP|nr:MULTISPECIES: iron ABC transporter permease [Rhodoplanes]MDC7787102.1 iron ABC transporter permease [Rhodoplanes tepidamans]MDC7987873.1 iron ABC transporter permease [Rhodoplanes sp. TEM]MDQ0358702.1 iron complex transport system permease protein [Rhodoplanes tepidamans]
MTTVGREETRPVAVTSSAAARRRAVGPVACGVLAVALLVSATVAVGLGAVAVPVDSVVAILGAELWPGGAAAVAAFGPAERAIVWELRLPRVLLGAAAGAGLSAIGATLQVLTRNPLADPYLFGISAGASVGAVLVILHAGPFAGPLTLPAAAFAGAMVAMAVVFAAARDRAGRTSSERLVLTGVAVAFVLHAITSFMIVTTVNRGAESALFWMMGGLANARWSNVPVPCGVTLCGTAWLILRAERINALALGDDAARTLGIDVSALRAEIFVVTALMTGAIVSAAGGIGFVGLVLPHVVRLVLGGNLRVLLPVAALLGAVFLVWVDVAARAAFAPREIPLGVMTSLIGGVFFLWLVRRRAPS